MQRERFPRSVYSQGEEPDARFSLANERTFLAWIRTGLALLAAGIGLEALGLHLQPQFARAASIVLIVAGIACAVSAWFNWASYERALRQHRPLPASKLSLPVGVAVGIAGALVLLGVVLR